MKNLLLQNCIFWVLLISAAQSSNEKDKEDPICWKNVAASLAGGVGAVVAAPAVLTAAGFTSAGIAAGSVASSMMSAVGNIGAGGLVSTLQSAGAAGFATSGKIVLGAAGNGIMNIVGIDLCKDD